MASTVLNNSQFPVRLSNILVADGILSGGDGLSLDGGLTANGTVQAQEVVACWVSSNPQILQSTLGTNGGGTYQVLGNGVGSQTTDNAYYTNASQVVYQCPTWNATYNYGPPHNNVLIVYGTNTAAVTDYPNNIFYSTGSPAVGTPPTATPAPYPVGGPVPNAGWALASAGGLAYGGSSVVSATGGMGLYELIVQGGFPGLFRFFNGGGESIGAGAPRGVDIIEGGVSATANNNNGCQVDVAGIVRSDGLYIHNTDQGLSPASSANALFIPASANGFVLGNNYTWTAPVAPETRWHWVGAAGTAGSMTLTGPANSMAFDPQCLMVVTRKFIAAAAHAIGNLCVDSKTATNMVISSRASADQSLVAADVGAVEWVCFNPDWRS